MNPPVFNGEESSEDADSWLRNIIGHFDRVQYDYDLVVAPGTSCEEFVASGCPTESRFETLRFGYCVRKPADGFRRPAGGRFDDGIQVLQLVVVLTQLVVPQEVRWEYILIWEINTQHDTWNSYRLRWKFHQNQRLALINKIEFEFWEHGED
ncbi:putative leucine-rich repeat receptor-like protein kinase [Dorcoceras hygrometricum]|uniref:Putative leucine-rich repeat receptor-like protein kinase n=1 Tax=Dorcoceras hygrometricum TaxID=472368 RepID=A0A2Z7DGP1_9LAMI|nr:putative leucine-rich repeat receptor-like protein kinase [Dorcoceras hygrometricum]